MVCYISIDDILIYSRNEEEHQEHLEIVLQRFCEHELLGKLLKCSYQKEIQYLGNIISTKRIAVDPTKLKAIKECPTPKNVLEVRSFMGLVGFYRKFVCSIQNCSTSSPYLDACVSSLKEYRANAEHIIDWNFLQVQDPMVVTIEPLRILEVHKLRLRNWDISQCMVQWDQYAEENATWEDYDEIFQKSHHLF